MKILRTPEERFTNLKGYDFSPNYLKIRDADGTEMRMHYVDEGPNEADPVLLMHGEPCWSYIYREVVGPVAAGGHRVLAPDLIGFGKSDKLVDRNNYTYERHVTWMIDWIEALDLKEITLFCQDWGGLIGLRLVAALPDRFARVIVSNSFLPEGESWNDEALETWMEFSQTVEKFMSADIINFACIRDLTLDEVVGFEAPYPEERYKTGARHFPTLVPFKPERPSVSENKAAWRILENFDKPFLTAFGEEDPLMTGNDAPFHERVPGTKGQPHSIIKGAGHFAQIDKPAEIADIINTFIASSS